MKHHQRLEWKMTKNVHHKLTEIEIAQLHHGWPVLPTELKSTQITRQKTAEQNAAQVNFKCAVCARLAQALIATGQWFEIRARGAQTA